MTNHKMILSTTTPNNNVPLIRIIQDDKNSQIFEAEMTEEGKLLDFEDKIVFFNAQIGPYKVRDKVESVDYTNSRVSYTLIDAFLQKVGNFEAWFSFADSDTPESESFSTMKFTYKILPGIRKNIWEGNYFWDLKELVDYYQRYKNIIANIIENENFSGLVDKIAEIEGKTNQIDNFSTATKTEAEQGTAANKFMTPQRVAQQTDARLSTSSEAINAMDDKKLMTPQKTALLINESRVPTTQLIGKKEMFLVYNPEAEPTLVLERMGDWVFMMMRWTSPTNVQANKVIDLLTIPNGFRSYGLLNVGLTAQYDATSIPTYSRINAGKTIQLKMVEGGSHGYSVNGIWRTGDPFPDDAGDITPALYHIDALEEFRRKINPKKVNIGFVTDSHFDEYTYRDAYSRYALKKLNNILYLQTNFDILHSNGDNCDSDHEDHETLLSYYKRYTDRWFRYRETPKFMVNGNHDDGSFGYAAVNNNHYLPSAGILTQEEFAELFRGNDRLYGETRSSTKQDYVYDIDKENHTVRVIGLDSIIRSSILDSNGYIKYPSQNTYGFSVEQLQFIYEALKNTDSKTHVAILMHVPVTDYLDGNGVNVNVDSFIQLISAFVKKETLTITGTNIDFPFAMEVDFTKTAGKFIATFTGHTHSEHLRLIDNTWYSVCHGRAMHSEGNSLTGTVKEDCFYCIEIDTSTKTVDVKGYGRGTASRKFTY